MARESNLTPDGMSNRRQRLENQYRLSGSGTPEQRDQAIQNAQRQNTYIFGHDPTPPAVSDMLGPGVPLTPPTPLSPSGFAIQGPEWSPPQAPGARGPGTYLTYPSFQPTDPFATPSWYQKPSGPSADPYGTPTPSNLPPGGDWGGYVGTPQTDEDGWTSFDPGFGWGPPDPGFGEARLPEIPDFVFEPPISSPSPLSPTSPLPEIPDGKFDPKQPREDVGSMGSPWMRFRGPFPPEQKESKTFSQYVLGGFAPGFEEAVLKTGLLFPIKTFVMDKVYSVVNEAIQDAVLIEEDPVSGTKALIDKLFMRVTGQLPGPLNARDKQKRTQFIKIVKGVITGSKSVGGAVKDWYGTLLGEFLQEILAFYVGWKGSGVISKVVRKVRGGPPRAKPEFQQPKKPTREGYSEPSEALKAAIREDADRAFGTQESGATAIEAAINAIKKPIKQHISEAGAGGLSTKAQIDVLRESMLYWNQSFRRYIQAAEKRGDFKSAELFRRERYASLSLKKARMEELKKLEGLRAQELKNAGIITEGMPADVKKAFTPKVLKEIKAKIAARKEGETPAQTRERLAALPSATEKIAKFREGTEQYAPDRGYTLGEKEANLAEAVRKAKADMGGLKERFPDLFKEPARTDPVISLPPGGRRYGAGAHGNFGITFHSDLAKAFYIAGQRGRRSKATGMRQKNPDANYVSDQLELLGFTPETIQNIAAELREGLAKGAKKDYDEDIGKDLDAKFIEGTITEALKKTPWGPERPAGPPIGFGSFDIDKLRRFASDPRAKKKPVSLLGPGESIHAPRSKYRPTLRLLDKKSREGRQGHYVAMGPEKGKEKLNVHFENIKKLENAPLKELKELGTYGAEVTPKDISNIKSGLLELAENLYKIWGVPEKTPKSKSLSLDLPARGETPGIAWAMRRAIAPPKKLWTTGGGLIKTPPSVPQRTKDIDPQGGHQRLTKLGKKVQDLQKESLQKIKDRESAIKNPEKWETADAVGETLKSILDYKWRKQTSGTVEVTAPAPLTDYIYDFFKRSAGGDLLKANDPKGSVSLPDFMKKLTPDEVADYILSHTIDLRVRSDVAGQKGISARGPQAEETLGQTLSRQEVERVRREQVPSVAEIKLPEEWKGNLIDPEVNPTERKIFVVKIPAIQEAVTQTVIENTPDYLMESIVPPGSPNFLAESNKIWAPTDKQREIQLDVEGINSLNLPDEIKEILLSQIPSKTFQRSPGTMSQERHDPMLPSGQEYLTKNNTGSAQRTAQVNLVNFLNENHKGLDIFSGGDTWTSATVGKAVEMIAGIEGANPAALGFPTKLDLLSNPTSLAEADKKRKQLGLKPYTPKERMQTGTRSRPAFPTGPDPAYVVFSVNMKKAALPKGIVRTPEGLMRDRGSLLIVGGAPRIRQIPKGRVHPQLGMDFRKLKLERDYAETQDPKIGHRLTSEFLRSQTRNNPAWQAESEPVAREYGYMDFVGGIQEVRRTGLRGHDRDAFERGRADFEGEPWHPPEEARGEGREPLNPEEAEDMGQSSVETFAGSGGYYQDPRRERPRPSWDPSTGDYSTPGVSISPTDPRRERPRDDPEDRGSGREASIWETPRPGGDAAGFPDDPRREPPRSDPGVRDLGRAPDAPRGTASSAGFPDDPRREPPRDRPEVDPNHPMHREEYRSNPNRGGGSSSGRIGDPRREPPESLAEREDRIRSQLSARRVLRDPENMAEAWTEDPERAEPYTGSGGSLFIDPRRESEGHGGGWQRPRPPGYTPYHRGYDLHTYEGDAGGMTASAQGALPEYLSALQPREYVNHIMDLIGTKGVPQGISEEYPMGKGYNMDPGTVAEITKEFVSQTWGNRNDPDRYFLVRGKGEGGDWALANELLSQHLDEVDDRRIPISRQEDGQYVGGGNYLPADMSRVAVSEMYSPAQTATGPVGQDRSFIRGREAGRATWDDAISEHGDPRTEGLDWDPERVAEASRQPAVIVFRVTSKKKKKKKSTLKVKDVPKDVQEAVETYRRTGFVTAREYLEKVAKEHDLTVQEALDLVGED